MKKVQLHLHNLFLITFITPKVEVIVVLILAHLLELQSNDISLYSYLYK
jgi:hypothetical protein